jgi:hypothetical protein
MLSLQSPYGHSKLPNVTGVGFNTVKVAINKDLADGAKIFTVPAGCRVRLSRGYWHNTTPWTGGASSTIGLSSDNASYNTEGDLLGGAGGDAAANLGAGFKGGTVGAKMANNGAVVLEPGDSVLFNKITSAFTAGEGFAVLEFVPVENV